MGHRGQRRLDEIGPLGVVEPGEREVRADPQAAPARLEQHSGRHRVVSGQHRGGRFSQGEQLSESGRTTLAGEIARRDEFGVPRHARAAEAEPVAQHPLVARDLPLRSADEPDPPVSLRHDVFGERRHGLDVLGADLVDVAARGQPVEQHGRHFGREELVDDLLVSRRGDQQQSLDAVRTQGANHRPLRLDVVVGVGQQHRVACGGGLALDRLDEGGHVGAAAE
ncbi:hypothetical protein ACZ91_32595 [Streptomyces regensis]|nr:hypothetical protein ACZ91_32595 [Streptomyces regensis]